MKKLRERIEKLHDITMDSDSNYTNKIIKEDINFLSLFTIASMNQTVMELGDDRLCALNYNYEKNPSIVIIYEINHMETNKRVSDKMMKLVEVLEDFYITLDSSFVIKENSISYLVIVKNITDENTTEI